VGAEEAAEVVVAEGSTLEEAGEVAAESILEEAAHRIRVGAVRPILEAAVPRPTPV
jgi:hypothetical protein